MPSADKISSQKLSLSFHIKLSAMPAKLTYSSPEDPVTKKMMIRSVEYLSGRAKLEKKYNEILRTQPLPHQIWEEMLNKLEVTLDFNQSQLNKVPDNKPIIFIANHPFGVLDGIAMGYLISRLHKKFKFLVNAALCKEELLNQYFLPIDFSESKKAIAANINTRQRAIEDLERGIPIAIFPSGGVATAPKFWKKAVDLDWKRFVIKLIKKSEATVIPIYFHGQNSRLFQIVSQFSMDLRLALLLNEVRNKMGHTIKVEIGDPVSYDLLQTIGGKKEMLDFLNRKVHSLYKS